MGLYVYGAVLFIAALVVLDIVTRKVFGNKYVCTVILAAGTNVLLINTWAGKELRGLWAAVLIACLAYFFLRVNIFPVNKKEAVSGFAKTLIGGRRLIYYGLFTGLCQSFIWLNMGKIMDTLSLSFTGGQMALQVGFSIGIVLILLANGFLRIFCLSKRLRLFRRLYILFTLWIPVFNVFLLLYLCHIAYLEYDHACYKVEHKTARIDSALCQTKYPILLLHGVGFRDFKYVNYWGRIPRELKRNGAQVFYGHQEAWGSVRENSQDIIRRIKEITEETGWEKVNIIAHSKGGLDARYVISSCGMDNRIASLTTISSPHRGCRFVDMACKTPEKIHRGIASIFDKYYKKIGDNNPDFYTATTQFTTTYLAQFNIENPDSPNVYYQSYTSVMKSFFSDFLLCIPYLIIKPLEGENDGLVSVTSAMWGEFKGVIRNKHRRGISHGDIIDLKREDYKGFDVIEKYVEIVADLKQLGF